MANNDIRHLLSGMRNIKATINESEQAPTPVIDSTASQSEIEDEKKSFNQAVGIASFGNFQKYKDNVVFQGTIGSGETLRWQLSLVDGLIISTQEYTLNDDNFAIIDKLKAYYEIWKNKWMTSLNGGSAVANTADPVDTSAASQGGSGGGMDMGGGMGGPMGI
jgi:hypothetical protein